ncbi:MAG: gliding motility-associated ABC transporter substrate-binding protein GldG [Sphingobacteriaceae bacterium]
MFALLRKEIAAFFNTSIAYLIIGIFLVITGILLWVLPDYSILSSGYAGLDGLFFIAPYLFLFLIPAICMRAIAEEKKEGTYELLVTRPLNLGQIIGAKYLAALCVAWLSLVPTFFYCFSVYQLGLEKGNLDFGATFGSYIGLLFLSAAFTAVGIFSSALTKNQIIAFVLAASFSLFLFIGLDFISQWPGLDFLAAFLQNLSIQEHYQSISRGVLDTRDLIYFFDLILVFLFLAVWKLSKPSFTQKNKIFIGLVAVVGINIIAINFFTRIDFTTEKRYTLSASTKNMLSKLDDQVQIALYLDGDLPAGFKRLKNASRDLLKDFSAYSDQNIELVVSNPSEGSPEQQESNFKQLLNLGIEPTNLSVKTDEGLTQKTIFPAAIVSYHGRQMVVKLLQSRMGASPEEVLNNSIQNLEYAFINALSKLSSGQLPRIGFTEGHNELSDIQLSDAFKSLQDGYEVGRVDLKSINAEGLDKLSLLVIPKPDRAFTELEKYKIDYFVQHGGRILWTIDQVNAELDSLSGRGEQLAFAKKLNLDDMLFKYGVRINYDLIADMNCAQIPMNVGNMGGQSQIQLVPWLFYPVFMPGANHPLVKNLDGIRTEFVSTVDTIPVKGIQKTILLSSSPYSKKADVPFLISLQMVEQQPDPRTFKGLSLPVGVLLEGVFPSVFQNRPLPEGVDASFPIAAKSIASRMLVIADGDVLKNQIGADGSTYPLGYDKYTQQQYGNKALLLNAVDYLTGDADLISLRNKEVKLRLLDRARIRTEKNFWQAFNLVVPLVLLAIAGFFQHWYRKRKYTA